MRAPSPYQSTPDRVIAAFQEARRLIATPQQWCRGKLTNGGQRLCLEGALRAATDGDPATLSDCMRVLRLMLGIPHDHIRALFDWNDVPGRQHAEVLEVLADAAANAEWFMSPGERAA